VTTNQVQQLSLGYFINPLVSVLLGYLFMRERLGRLPLASIGIVAVGVFVMALYHGRLPWIALILAATFGLYGLLRKVAAVEALTGLAVETLLLFLVAAGYLCYLGVTGRGAFPSPLLHDNLLLPLAGVITAIPLLWFAATTRRLRLATIGFMQ
jgi:chloramphenicol-sensitive protein RarD